MRSPLSTVFVISAGRVVQIAAGLVAVRLFTSLLSTAEVGNLYLINSLTAFFGFALLNPVGMYIHRKMNRWVNDGVLLRRFFLYNGYIVATAAVSVPTIFLLHHVLAVGGGVSLMQMLVYVVCYLFINTWNQTVVTTFNLLEHRVSFVGYTLATTILGLVLSVLLVFWSHTAVWWLAGQVAAQAMVTSTAFLHLRYLLGKQTIRAHSGNMLTGPSLKHVLGFVLPLSMTTLLTWTQSQSYRLIIENRIGLDYLGKIGLGFSIAANVAAAVESIAQQVYFPAFYREVSGGDTNVRRNACNSMFQRTIPLFLSQAMAVTFLAPFLVRILAHVKFEGAFIYVMFAAWIELFRMTTGILSVAAHAEMRTRAMVMPYLTGSILAVAGVLGGSSLARYEVAIPAALTGAGFVTMALMFREMKKIISVKVGIRQIAASGLATLPCAGALLFYALRESVISSLVILTVSGSYLLITQFIIFRRTPGGTPC